MSLVESNMIEKLCDTLQPILKLELSRGNAIESIDAPAGSSCPFAINLRKKMAHGAISKLVLTDTVEKWENRDSHYPLQSGYACSKYKHSIAGPL